MLIFLQPHIQLIQCRSEYHERENHAQPYSGHVATVELA